MGEPSIRLSEKYGANPAMLACPNCGKDNGEIALLGKVQEYECESCHGKIIGKRPKKECPHCQARSGFINHGEFEAAFGTRLPGNLCDDCKKKIEEVKAEIEKGGVPWRCKDCGSEGCIKHDAEIAIDFRKEHGDNIGMEFSKVDCPVCRDKGGQ